jgi:hypothetical protein
LTNQTAPTIFGAELDQMNLLMNPSAALRIIAFALFSLSVMTAKDKNQAPPTYLHGTITGWSNQVYQKSYARDAASRMGNKKFYDLKGAGLIYQIAGVDHPWRGAVSACGPFTIGQAVDYRVEDNKIYFPRENGKEQKCEVSSERTDDDAKADNSVSATH